MPRVTADVLYHHLHTLAAETLYLRELTTYLHTVNVAIHTTQRSNGTKGVSHTDRAKVTGVPYLITL